MPCLMHNNLYSTQNSHSNTFFFYKKISPVIYFFTAMQSDKERAFNFINYSTNAWAFVDYIYFLLCLRLIFFLNDGFMQQTLLRK